MGGEHPGRTPAAGVVETGGGDVIGAWDVANGLRLSDNPRRISGVIGGGGRGDNQRWVRPPPALV